LQNKEDYDYIIDGEPVAQGRPFGKLAANKEPLWIGARPAGVSAAGIIDEVRFCDRALSEDRIEAPQKGEM